MPGIDTFKDTIQLKGLLIKTIGVTFGQKTGKSLEKRNGSLYSLGMLLLVAAGTEAVSSLRVSISLP